VQTEEVIHHFRCANVSPEHTYNFGGQLRCPKCHKILRHIGMDYDRPAVIHTCNICGNTFIEPKSQTLCTSCHELHDAEELIPQDVNVYEITSEGKQSIISPNIGFTIYTEFYDNYIEYNRFVSRIRLLAEQKFSGNIDGDLLVGKIWILNEEGETMAIRPEEIELVCLYFPNNKISAANNITYVGSVIRDIKDGDTEEEIINFQVMMSETLRAAVSILKPGETICYSYMKLQGNQSTVNDFIKEMDYISPTPDDSVSCDKEASNTKAEAPASVEDEIEDM
jgi:ribosomal protein S27E